MERFEVRGIKVLPLALPEGLAELVPRSQQVDWPTWLDPGPRMLRDILELSRLQTARGLTVLSWLAGDEPPHDLEWLWPARRLTGTRQERMYGAAGAVPDAVLSLVVANWTWALATRHGGRIIAPYLAEIAYPRDGHQAAHSAMTLYQTYERHPDARAAIAAAWSAAKVGADWCKAAELRAAYGSPTPVFTYPRASQPPPLGVRPWLERLFRLR